jgi:hypothetical protein
MGFPLDQAPATAIRETGGATLQIGAVPNGDVLERSGTSLVGVVPAAFSANRQALTGTLTLTSGSAQAQYLDPNGADRTVNLPAGGSGLYYYVKNIQNVTGNAVGNFYRLIVRDASNVLVAVVTPGVTYQIVWDGSAWECPTNPTPKPYMWFRADAGTYQDVALTIPTTTSGQNVKGWIDQANTGRAITTGGGSNFPLYETGIVNGNPVVRFTGIGGVSLFSTWGNGLASTITAFAVISRPTWSSSPIGGVWAMYLTTYPNGSTTGLILTTDGTGGVWGGAMGGYGAINGPTGANGPAVSQAVPSLASSSPHLLTTGLGFNSAMWLDGARQTTTFFNGPSQVASIVPSQVVYVGSDGGGDIFDGDVAELIVFNSELSDDVRCFWSQYLGDKYGLTIASG